MLIPDLMGKVGKSVYKIGFGKCMKNKWAKKVGDRVIGLKLAGQVDDDTQDHLKALQNAGGDITKNGAPNDKQITDLKKRKLINLVTRNYFSVTRGKAYSPKRVKRAANLTKEMLDSGD